jgi:hypothetical protein
MRKALLTIAILVAPRAALACPVCFGASDSPLAAAINMGVIMMLGVVAVMLGSFGAFFVYLNRRAKLLAAGAIDTGAYASGLGAAVRVPGTNPQEGTASC